MNRFVFIGAVILELLMPFTVTANQTCSGQHIYHEYFFPPEIKIRASIETLKTLPSFDVRAQILGRVFFKARFLSDIWSEVSEIISSPVDHSMLSEPIIAEFKKGSAELNLPPITNSKYEAAAQTLFAKLKENMSDLLEPNELVIISYLLRSKEINDQPVTFQLNRIIKNRTDIEGFAPRFRGILAGQILGRMEKIHSTPELRKSLHQLWSLDEVLANYIERASWRIDPASGKLMMYGEEIQASVKLAHELLVQHLRQYQSTPPSGQHISNTAVITMVFGGFLTTLADRPREEFENILADRHLLLLELEADIASRMPGTQNYDFIIEAIDHYIYGRPLSPSPTSLAELAANEARTLLLPLKNDLSASKAKDSAPAAELKTKAFELLQRKSRNPFAVQERAPHKRARRNRDEPVAAPVKVESAEKISADVALFRWSNFVINKEARPSIAELGEDKLYFFEFQRNSQLPVQKIRFTRRALDGLSEDPAEATKLITAVIWGHTNRSAEYSAGLKRLRYGQDLYEARPGDSAKRLILEYRDGSWVALRVVDKDSFERSFR